MLNQRTNLSRTKSDRASTIKRTLQITAFLEGPTSPSASSSSGTLVSSTKPAITVKHTDVKHELPDSPAYSNISGMIDSPVSTSFPYDGPAYQETGRSGPVNSPSGNNVHMERPMISDRNLSDKDEDEDLTAMEEERLTRIIDHGTPGDSSASFEYTPVKTLKQKQLAKQKSQYYDGAFAVREVNSSAREIVIRESIICAEVKTNVIVQDEYTLITSLSHTLALRYQRPDSSVLVSLTHSACLLLGGSFDPAYILSITAVPSLVQPVTNKRNAILVGKIMEENLGVSPERGVIKFIACPEENYAFNSKTVAGEIEDLEKVEKVNGDAHWRRDLHGNSTKVKSRHSLRSLRNLGRSGNAIAADKIERERERVQSPNGLRPGTSGTNGTTLTNGSQGVHTSNGINGLRGHPTNAHRVSTMDGYGGDERSRVRRIETPVDMESDNGRVTPPPILRDPSEKRAMKVSRRRSFMAGLFGR